MSNREPFVPADEDTIRELTDTEGTGGYHVNRELAKAWSREKALTVLYALRHQRRRANYLLTKQQSEAERREMPAAFARGQPSQLERLMAAEMVEAQMEEGGPDDVLMALLYTSHAWMDHEVMRFAGYVVKMFRGATTQNREAA